MRCAAIDIGTNSCRLLIADMVQGKLHPVQREMRSTRLGQGVDASGVLAAQAIERTLLCLQEFTNIMQSTGAERYRVVATSAVREAANRQDFVDMVYQQCGLTVDIIDGEEEADLSYRGVNCGLVLDRAPLVVDLGGGSCEFVLQTAEERLALSLPLGAVRATEAEYNPEDIRAILSPLTSYREKYKDYPLVFVGGTATTIVAVRLALPVYDSNLVHGQVLTLSEIEDVYQLLVSLPVNLRKRLPGLQPERADIIPAGVLVVVEIMKALKRKQMWVSETDILDGIICRQHK